MRSFFSRSIRNWINYNEHDGKQIVQLDFHLSHRAHVFWWFLCAPLNYIKNL